MPRPDPAPLIALAARTDAICAQGGYDHVGQRIALAADLAASCAGTILVAPQGWPAIEQAAMAHCRRDRAGRVLVTQESTLAALQRLALDQALPAVAALNFASARSPGGGYRNGAVAQEETLARSSGLVPTLELERCQAYYQGNRRQGSLLYTDHAIWSPRVPFFATDAGALLPRPYLADIITMPAPNAGSMRTEADLRAVVPTFRRRIRWILALAVSRDVEHLVLGAWGCGVFGNHPELVAGLFRDALRDDQPWRRSLSSVTFAIFDPSPRRAAYSAFAGTMAELALLPGAHP